MTAFYLLVSFLFIRFIFLSLLDRKATGRAAHFASMQGKEIIAYYLYQLSTLMLLIVPFFLKVTLHFSSFFYLGLGAYLLGSVLLFLVIKDFANPDEKGLNTILVYGETPKQDREELINEFRDGAAQVLISNPNTLGESISLHQTVHDAVYFI